MVIIINKTQNMNLRYNYKLIRVTLRFEGIQIHRLNGIGMPTNHGQNMEILSIGI